MRPKKERLAAMDSARPRNRAPLFIEPVAALLVESNSQADPSGSMNSNGTATALCSSAMASALTFDHVTRTITLEYPAIRMPSDSSTMMLSREITTALGPATRSSIPMAIEAACGSCNRRRVGSDRYNESECSLESCAKSSKGWSSRFAWWPSDAM